MSTDRRWYRSYASRCAPLGLRIDSDDVVERGLFAGCHDGASLVLPAAVTRQRELRRLYSVLDCWPADHPTARPEHRVWAQVAQTRDQGPTTSCYLCATGRLAPQRLCARFLSRLAMGRGSTTTPLTCLPATNGELLTTTSEHAVGLGHIRELLNFVSVGCSIFVVYRAGCGALIAHLWGVPSSSR